MMKRLYLSFAAFPLALVCAAGAVTTTAWGSASTTSAVACFGQSAQSDADGIAVKGAWIQEGPPSQKITAAFMVIENHGASDTSLVSASTDAANVVELHKMELEDGMMKMHRVESISVPAGGQVELKPGGYHLMVIGLKRELKEGDEVKVTLRFAGDVEKTVTVPVKKRDSAQEERSSGR